MNGFRADLLFALKSIMKDNPFAIVTLSSLSAAAIGSYCLMIFERPLYIESGHHFEQYFTSMWGTVVTMTTVGYGDVFPKTVFGRVTGIVICVCGLFLTSLFTVTLTNYLEFKPHEDKSFNLLQRLYFKEILKR